MAPRKSQAIRRAEIISAAAAIIVSKGFTTATTRDVTRYIGVGSGLLNHYFSWAELRRLAFDEIASLATTETFAGIDALSATQIMRRFVKDTFSMNAKPYLRVWIEAMDEAAKDPQLAKLIDQHAAHFRRGLVELIESGNDQRVWKCADPQGGAWRILAMHDGLVGFVVAGAPVISQRQAKRHLEIAIAHECVGFA